MNPALLRIGDGPSGLGHMRFTLVYDGDLWPTGNKGHDRSKKKWEVRRQFDPQLRRLWNERTDLDHLRTFPRYPKDGHGMWVQAHPLYPSADRSSPQEGPLAANEINLCEPIQRGTRTFFPLVRKSLGLTCGLKVLFLRNEPKGNLFNKQSGDLDNRIKTLVDALSIPTDEWVYDDPALTDPVYCLLEDDGLVTALEVRTEQLLSPKGSADKEVRLMVEVDVRVAHPRSFNLLFAGE